MQGAFAVQPWVAGRAGKCLQQMAATKPIECQDDSDAFTLVGDPSWTNYVVSVDAELAKPGVLELIGRAGVQKRPQSHQEGYLLPGIGYRRVDSFEEQFERQPHCLILWTGCSPRHCIMASTRSHISQRSDYGIRGRKTGHRAHRQLVRCRPDWNRIDRL